MFHFQVVSMGARLLFLYVICQAAIIESLGGITLPFSDSVGIVTPVKPKLLSPSAVSSSVTKSSLVCDSKDILPKLFLPAPGTQEFSSPIAFTSSSRALPVPKIDSLTIADVKLPERLREKFLLTKLRNAAVSNAKPDTGTPNVSLPHKRPFVSSSTKPPNALPTYSTWDMYSSSLNKLPSLSNIKSLPNVPVEPLKSIDTDVIRSASKSNNVLAQPSITPLTKSRIVDSPLTLEARKPSFSEHLNSNTFSPLTSCSTSYPLYYESIYLPGVQTPSEILPLSFRPISYKAAGNIDCQSQSDPRNLLSPKTLTSDTSLNSLSGRNDPYLSTYMNPIKTTEIPKPVNTIQLPKTPSNVHVSIKSASSAQNVAAKNLSPPLEENSGSASVVFDSTFKPPNFLSSPVLNDCTDPKMLRNFIPYSMPDKIPDFKLKPCNPIKIRPSAVGSTSNVFNSPTTSLVPISPSSPIVDVLSNRLSSFDCSLNINTPDIFPIIGACVETIEKINTNDPSSNSQTCVDSKDVPSLERINLSSPFAPKLASYQHPIFTEECVTNPLKYSPPIIPLEPTISFETSAFSPFTYFTSKIPQTPSSVSYINQSPSFSIAQSTSKMVSSINDLVSNIAQNILSSYKSYTDFAPQNIPQKPTIQTNPYGNPEFITKQTLPVLQLPQNNPVNTESIMLPVMISPIDSKNLPAVDISTILSSDAPCKSSVFQVSSNQPSLSASRQPTATVLPSTSMITFPSPQLCPSRLPSPSLPSYLTMASPFYIEAPVLKVCPSKKDSDVEKFIELMLLTEILNKDESFDWDDLDTLLAFLSAS